MDHSYGAYRKKTRKYISSFYSLAALENNKRIKKIVHYNKENYFL